MAEKWLRYKLWFPMVAKAGLRRLDMHSIRHTYASRLIASGENLKYVQEQLGHASITSTCDTYGHPIPGGNPQAVDTPDSFKISIGTVAKTVTNASENSYAFDLLANTVASQAMYLICFMGTMITSFAESTSSTSMSSLIV
jgi:hypothetical protein